MGSGGQTQGSVLASQRIYALRKGEERQQILINCNGPGTSFKDRYYHPHFRDQETWALRHQVIGS